MSDFTDSLSRAKKIVIKKTDELSKLARISMEIEGTKARLCAIYEKIGEGIVNDSLSGRKLDDEKIAMLVIKAKEEKAKLSQLIEKKNELSDKTYCPSCGKSAQKGAFCPYCGEKVK